MVEMRGVEHIAKISKVLVLGHCRNAVVNSLPKLL